ncbi:expressed unknown protein [Ectocarpus siliculosus]|uniref:Uncharacterized protein n=1 Tax=Ectocarpus siliculosus TaxID=2880 RepID=D7G8X6_ECTSI|nr:expressed unknown protein [Ectocarpus siliculosus]|eukprot:CBJ28144.1 expressed unknown protein [Ectocarpus siliculosus]
MPLHVYVAAPQHCLHFASRHTWGTDSKWLRECQICQQRRTEW